MRSIVLDEIGNRIVASIAHEIEMVERNRAILKPPNSLDAWEAHHRGLWHMYRFNKADNDRARQFFDAGGAPRPDLCAGLCRPVLHAFPERVPGLGEARAGDRRGPSRPPGKSLMVDDRDPAAHWAMGRALWLRGGQDQSIVELERAVDLCPNFATGPLHARLRAFAVGRSAGRGQSRPTTRAS